MPLSARRPLFALIVICSLACISKPASANSVGVNGTAYGGNDSNGLSLTAGIVSIFSAAPIGYSQVGGGAAGVPMTLSFWVLPWSGPDNATVNIGSKFTDILQGTGILFTGSFTVPFSALAKGTFTAPISFTSQLLAYQDLTLGQGSVTPGPLMASLVSNGTGMGTFQLTDAGNGQFIIPYATFDFKGTGNLTIVPEPGSLFLLGTGLAGFGTMCWRRILFRSPA
jgi:hypothetical protein